MPTTEKYGRVLIQHSCIDMIAMGGTFSADYNNRLIAAVAIDHLKIRAALNGSWAAVRVVVHGESRPSTVADSDEWDETDDAEVTFTGPPFLYVDAQVGWMVEPTLHDLGAKAGVYSVRASANGVNEAMRGPVVPLVELDQAPPAEALVQQFRIDMWPGRATTA